MHSVDNHFCNMGLRNYIQWRVKLNKSNIFYIGSKLYLKVVPNKAYILYGIFYRWDDKKIIKTLVCIHFKN